MPIKMLRIHSDTIFSVNSHSSIIKINFYFKITILNYFLIVEDNMPLSNSCAVEL